jgi:hypothetical protein
MDILVRWLFSGVAYDNDALCRRLVGHVGRIAQQLDAVVVLPLMDLAPQEATNEFGLHRLTTGAGDCTNKRCCVVCSICMFRV